MPDINIRKPVSFDELMSRLDPVDRTADERVHSEDYFFVPIKHFAGIFQSGNNLRSKFLMHHAICICDHKDLQRALELYPSFKSKSIWAFGSIFTIKGDASFKHYVVGFRGVFQDWLSRSLENNFYVHDYHYLLCAKRNDCDIPQEFKEYYESMRTV